jgi:lysozyme
MKLAASPRLMAAIGAAAAAVVVPMVVQHEGVVPRGYRDPIGIVTYCVGGTGPEAVLGKTYSMAECQKQLEKDLIEHDEDMMSCVRVPLNPYQRAAFLSFTFNVGAARFCGSTLVSKLNKFDYEGACKELLRWTLAGGKELPGLVKRRQDEMTLCLKPYVAEGES